MLFNSFEFALFLTAVLCVYWALRQNLRWQNICLVIASYCFYGLWDWRFLTLIAFSTTVDYLIAQRIAKLHAADDKPLANQSREAGESAGSDLASDVATSPVASHQLTAKRWLQLSLACNLGLLGVFKYFNFFVDSFIALGAQIGLNLDTPALRLLPPVGISFYTFQSMAYSIDVYRRQLKPERNFITFALFISYFPQLVAGPIERANRLLPQFQQARQLTVDCIRGALVLMLIGLFKKVVIADNAGVAVNRIFSDIESQSSLALIAGGILFTLQIYGDFSGYSNMARGMSRLLGVRLVENFKTPYLSVNISEFWRRWHISLSQWLRDYLYIPLGGSRDGEWRTRRNLMITMLLGGLWHGAAWTYVIWGALNGVYLVVHRWWQQRAQAFVDERPSRLMRYARWTLAVSLTYLCVMFAFVVFRAESLSDVIAYGQGLLALRGGVPLSDIKLILILGALLAPLELIQYTGNDRLLAVRNLSLPLRASFYALLVLSLVLASSTDIPFIYFQF